MKELLLALGIALGLVGAQPEPGLACRAYQYQSSLFINVEVVNALPEPAIKALESGNSLELVLDCLIADKSFRFHNRIDFDPLEKVYTVTSSRETASHKVARQDAARELHSSFFALDLGQVEDLGFPATLDITASIVLPDREDLDARLVWQYHQPHWSRTWNRSGEISR